MPSDRDIVLKVDMDVAVFMENLDDMGIGVFVSMKPLRRKWYQFWIPRRIQRQATPVLVTELVKLFPEQFFEGL